VKETEHLSLREAIAEVLERAITEMNDKSVELVKVNKDGNVRIPLYFVDESGRSASYCNVDLLIIKDDKIRAIFEVEEGGIDPIRICGTYLMSSFSQFHIHNEEDQGRRIPMDPNATFIQIINAPTPIVTRIDKAGQLEKIKKMITSNPIKNSNITDYELLTGTSTEFKKDDRELLSVVKKALANPEKQGVERKGKQDE
jgi:hypothetical protein